MARSNDPVSGVPTNTRYAESRDYSKGDAGSYEFRAATLEEEVHMGGWLPGAHPTGDDGSLIDLWTTSSRGDPSLDNDPVPDPSGGYEQGK